MRDGKRADRIKRDENRRLRKLEKQRVKENAVRTIQKKARMTQMDALTIHDATTGQEVEDDPSTLNPLPLSLDNPDDALADVDDAVAAATEVMNKISQPSLSEQEELLII